MFIHFLTSFFYYIHLFINMSKTFKYLCLSAYRYQCCPRPSPLDFAEILHSGPDHDCILGLYEGISLTNALWGYVKIMVETWQTYRQTDRQTPSFLQCYPYFATVCSFHLNKCDNHSAFNRICIKSWVYLWKQLQLFASKVERICEWFFAYLHLTPALLARPAAEALEQSRSSSHLGRGRPRPRPFAQIHFQ